MGPEAEGVRSFGFLLGKKGGGRGMMEVGKGDLMETGWQFAGELQWLGKD